MKNIAFPRRSHAFAVAATTVVCAGLASAHPAGAAAAVQITNPLDKAAVSGSVTYTATADGNAQSVDFLVDGNVASTDNASPWQYGADGRLDTSKLSDGTHKLQVRAKYRKRTTLSSTVEVYVQNATAPAPAPLSVNLTTPTQGSTVSGTVAVQAATDGGSGGVSKVEFWTDGSMRSVDSTAPFNWNWDTGGLSGAHQVGAVAYDGAGNRVAAPNVDVTVGSTTTPASPSGTPAWSSSFDASPWYSEWDGDDPSINQPGQPQDPPIAAIDPTTEGVPRLDGNKVMRFPMSAADSAAGRIHSKLYKTWNINAAGGGKPGLNGDVSGSYRAWVYWPTGRRLSVTDNAVTGLIGWKEIAQNRTIQDSTYWITVVPRAWVDGYSNVTWVGPRPSDPSYPVAFFRYWNYGKGSPDSTRPLKVMAVPEGRWFEARADLYDHSHIDWYLDGQSIGTGQDSTYPVGPQYGRAAGDQWIWEIGNYGNGKALGTTYFDKNTFTRF